MFVVGAKLVKIGAYLAFVGGLGALCLKISAFAGQTALVLAAPHLVPPTTPAVTLVERRRQVFDGGMVAEVDLDRRTVVPDAPGMSSKLLAARLDQAEQPDTGHSSTETLAADEALSSDAESFALLSAEIEALEAPPQTRRRNRTARPAPARVAAADVFGQSFGVMLRVSR
jgi:hypothetical protein